MKWISVKDALPASVCIVLIYIRHNPRITLGMHVKGGFYRAHTDKVEILKSVSHWMPLPEKPSGT